MRDFLKIMRIQNPRSKLKNFQSSKNIYILCSQPLILIFRTKKYIFPKTIFVLHQS